MASVVGTIADFIVNVVDAHKSEIIDALGAANVKVETLVVSYAQNLITAKEPAIAPFINPLIAKEGPALIAFLGGEEAALVTALDAFLHAEATKLGGDLAAPAPVGAKPDSVGAFPV